MAASHSLLRRLEVVGVGPARQISIDFGKRLTILTGDNGLGKSFVLEILWWMLTDSVVHEPILPRDLAAQNAQVAVRMASSASLKRFVPESQDWQQAASPHHGMLRRSLVMHVGVEGSFGIYDALRAGAMPPVARTPPPGAVQWLTQRELWNGKASEDGKVVANGLVRDWVLWQLRGGEPFDLLLRALAELSPDSRNPLRPGQPVRVSVTDQRDIPTILMPYGAVPVIHASAGIRRVLGIAYALAWSWHEHVQASRLRGAPTAATMVLLFDEVEAHLHPQWQRLLLPALLRVVEALSSETAVQLVANTHSPLVMASMEPHWDPDRDELAVLEAHDGDVRIRSNAYARQGDAASWLVSEAFGLEQARSVEAQRAIEAAEAFMRGDQDVLPAGLSSAAAIDDELRRVLAGNDHFWPRWVVWAESHGQRAS